MILEAVGEDPKRKDLVDTPDRVAEMYEEILAGMPLDPEKELEVVLEHKHEEIVLLKGIPLYSMCEHHLLPFIGRAHVAYIPKGGRVTGLSKIELERSGAKISTNKGKVEFEITAYLSKDYDNKWSNTPFMKNVRRIYDSYIIRDRIERLEGELVNEYQALIDEIRSFLVLHKF